MGSTPKPLSGFYLNANGVTVECPGVPVGATSTLGGPTYTKRDRAGLLAASAADLVTSCTTGVTDMSNLFDTSNGGNTNGGTFNGNIGSWDTAAVTDMSYMFQSATAFNQDVSNWNTGEVTNMRYMFNGATRFNNGETGNTGAKPLNWANTAKLGKTWRMFMGATAFNQDVSNWNMGELYDMVDMFRSATAFNTRDPRTTGAKPLNWATTVKLKKTQNMFNGASAFNQDVSGWNVAAVNNCNDFCLNAGFSSSSYLPAFSGCGSLGCSPP